MAGCGPAGWCWPERTNWSAQQPIPARAALCEPMTDQAGLAPQRWQQPQIAHERAAVVASAERVGQLLERAAAQQPGLVELE